MTPLKAEDKKIWLLAANVWGFTKQSNRLERWPINTKIL